MGWLFRSGYTKSDWIKALIKTEEDEQRRRVHLCHCVRGNVLWSVVEITEKQNNDRRIRYIACDLLASHGDGYGWGYKDMCESVEPFQYSCPLRYLEMVPEVTNALWRERVRLYHQRRAVTVGQKVALIGTSVPWVTIVSTRPLMGIHNGVRYRIPGRFLGDVIAA